MSGCSGVVKAVAEGTATITATVGGKTATCTVTVISISIDEATLSLAIGNVSTLTATVLPTDATDPTVTWESSNASVATVSNGVVTAVAAGTATITAKTFNNKTATCTVKVYNPSIGVVINGVIWAKFNVDTPGTFAATPESYGKFYQWNRSKAWDATGSVTGWDITNPTGNAWAPANDPSPAGWRIPTTEEVQKLRDIKKVENYWVTEPIAGGFFTDKTTGATLFLPAAGYRYDDDGTLHRAGTEGYYWSSSTDGAYHAYHLEFGNGFNGWGNYLGRTSGFSVRCVAE